ncbi:C40 family peptidase [Nocardiopsis coralliicola]
MIDSYGENGNYGEEVRVPIDIPSDLLPIYETAATEYGIPFEIIAAIGAKESHHGRLLWYGPGQPSGVQEPDSNPYGAAGIMQMGIGGAATNGWGGKPKERVEDRPHVNEVGVVPTDPSIFGRSYYGTDGNGDGIVNVWDPWDNIISATFKLAYIKARAETDFGAAPSDVCASADPAIEDPLDCGLYRHNLAHWYVDQVKAIASVYAEDGTWDTAPALNIQPAALTTNTATGEDCTPGASPAGIPGIPLGAGDHQEAVIAYAREQLGKPYSWGATGPDTFDCSGLTMRAYEAAGITTPRITTGQFNPDAPEWSVPVEKFQTDGLVVDELQPGDLVFFHTQGKPNPPSHMGLYIGNDEMIHAGNPVNVATVSTYAQGSTEYVGAVRVYPDATDA